MGEKVSVIIPVYNRETYLEKCLNSLLNQTWKDIEVITIDDHSTDNSYAMLLEYAQKDNRIKVFRNQKKGPGSARNIGLEHAVGDYIMVVDSDDYVAPDFIEKMLGVLKESDAEIVQCNYARVNDGKEEPYIACSETMILTGRELMRKQISFVGMYTPSTIACNKLYKRSVWDDVRYDEEHRFEDVFTTYKTIYPCKKIVLIPDVLYYWVIHEDSTSLSDMQNDNCTDIIRAWVDKTEYLMEHNEQELVRLNKRRCYYVAAQQLYRLKKLKASKEAIDYHKNVIRNYFPDLICYDKWSVRTRLRMIIIRVCPELFGQVSLRKKIDFEK